MKVRLRRIKRSSRWALDPIYFMGMRRYKRKRKIIIRVQNRQRRIPIAVGRLKVLAENILAKMKCHDSELGLVWVNDRQIRRLNARYRGQDQPTDVLSFSSDASASFKGPDAPPSLLGDVVISLETARARGKGLYFQVGRLLIHGILHLLGFDHENPVDAQRMRRKERELAKEFLIQTR